MSQGGWETAKTVAQIGGTVAGVLTFIGALINRFFKFVTWTDLRRTVAAITQNQEKSDKAAEALNDQRHGFNSGYLQDIKRILEKQNEDTIRHRALTTEQIGIIQTRLAVIDRRLDESERREGGR